MVTRSDRFVYMTEKFQPDNASHVVYQHKVHIVPCVASHVPKKKDKFDLVNYTTIIVVRPGGKPVDHIPSDSELQGGH